MNYRKLEEFRFLLFSYGLLLLGLLFVVESALTYMDLYAKLKFIAQHGYVFSTTSVFFQVTIATMKLVAGMLFFYIAMEELKSIRMEEKIYGKRLSRKRR